MRRFSSSPLLFRSACPWRRKVWYRGGAGRARPERRPPGRPTFSASGLRSGRGPVDKDQGRWSDFTPKDSKGRGPSLSSLSREGKDRAHVGEGESRKRRGEEREEGRLREKGGGGTERRRHGEPETGKRGKRGHYRQKRGGVAQGQTKSVKRKRKGKRRQG